jgi:hypothetical protein
LYGQKTKEGEENQPSNNIYINLLGDASIISINYERRFYVTPTYFLIGKIGYGYNEEFDLCVLGTCASFEKYPTIPHHISVNIGKRRHYLEVGIGGTYIGGKADEKYIIYPIAGYRLHPLRKNKINFRIYGEYPLSGDLLREEILFIPIGFSMGLSF